MSKFIVRLTNEFSAISGALMRRRAGIEVPVEGGITADLTDDQIKEINDDQYLTLHDPKTGALVVDGLKSSDEKKAAPKPADEAPVVADAAPTKSATTKA